MTARSRATDERPPIIVIDQAVIDNYDLHPLAGWLYVVIIRHVNRKKNDAFPSVARLAKLANMSKASVLRYTKVLEQAGLIAVERDDSTGDYAVNHYRLLAVKGGVSQKQVVSDSNHLSIPQQPQVVSDSNTNHIESNQKKEPEGNTPPEKTHLNPAVAEAIDNALDSAYQPIDNHTGAMMQADVFIRVFEGACKAWNAPQTIQRTRANKRIAAQWYVDGYTADEIRSAVNALFDAKKPAAFAFLGEKLAFMRSQKAAPMKAKPEIGMYADDRKVDYDPLTRWMPDDQKRALGLMQ